MLNKLVPALVSIAFYVVAVLGAGLIVAFIFGAYTGLSSGGDILRPAFFFRTLANLLFLAGGLILTFGAFLEFFVKARSPSIALAMMRPYEIFSRIGALKAMDRDAAIADERSGGWLLVFIGAVIIAISFVFAIISLK